MTLKVLQHIRQRLAAVVNKLKSTIRQEVVKAYLIRITTAKSLEFEPGAELYDDSWMEYINKDYITNTSDPSYPTLFSPHEKIKEPFL